MTVPRKHHWLPTMFLSAWTNDGSAAGQLQVLDKKSLCRWSVKPVNAAVERDLYMIDMAEVEGDIVATEIEDTFATIEGVAAPVIKSILDGNEIPTGEDLENLIALIAIMAIRVPARLDWIDDVMRAPVEACLQRLEANGELPLPEDPELAARMKEWISQGLIQVQIKQNPRLAMMVSMLPTIMDLLMRRHWSVLRVSSGSRDLICVDHPVLLEWIRPVPDGTSPGFGLQNTAVFVPIGPETALLGLWDAQPQTHLLANQQVAFWNGELLGHVDRFVFSRGDFVAMHLSGELDNSAKVLERWSENVATT